MNRKDDESIVFAIWTPHVQSSCVWSDVGIPASRRAGPLISWARCTIRVWCRGSQLSEYNCKFTAIFCRFCIYSDGVPM